MIVNLTNMPLDLQARHCVKLLLHAHFAPGEPSRNLLIPACGARFARKATKAEGYYTVAGKSYKVTVSLDRSKRETIVNVSYESFTKKLPKGRSAFDIEKFWTCLQKVAITPLWRCRVFFEFPSSSYFSRFDLPTPLDRPIEGFNEICGVKLVNSVRGAWIYSVIVDTNPKGDVYDCSVSFTIERSGLAGLADEVLKKATEICGRAIEEGEKQKNKENVG